MRRREFIAGFGSVAAWPLVARAQQGDRVRRIGVLTNLPADDAQMQTRNGALLEALQRLGWTPGRNVEIEYRWGGEVADRNREYAAELVALAPDVIVSAGGSPGLAALQRATRTVPIVFANIIDPVGQGFVEGHGWKFAPAVPSASGLATRVAIGRAIPSSSTSPISLRRPIFRARATADPVEIGLVSSLDHPGGNITGVISISVDIGSKPLGLLRDLLPGAKRVAMLINPNDDARVVKLMIEDALGAAIVTGQKIEVFYAGNVSDIDTAFASLVEKRSEVLLVSPSGFFSSHRTQIVAQAAQHRIPALYFERDYAEVGGLMSCGANVSEQYRQLGIYAGRILNGKKPGDLPVRAIRSEFVINLKTAKELGLTIPQVLLATADEVIE